MQNNENTNYLEEGFTTAAEKAYSIISKKILDGEFKPGCKLSRRKMAEATGVSVIPVIEALNRLEEDGLVESKPQWGSFVTIPTLEKIADIYVLREAIECQIARILSQKITAEQEEELYVIANKLDNTKYNINTSSELAQAHYEFHSKMSEYAGYNSLINSLKRINLFWILCKAVSVKREKSTLPEKWHTKLVNAIKSGDPDKAENMMRIHVLTSLEAYGVKLGTEKNV